MSERDFAVFEAIETFTWSALGYTRDESFSERMTARKELIKRLLMLDEISLDTYVVCLLIIESSE